MYHESNKYVVIPDKVGRGFELECFNPNNNTTHSVQFMTVKDFGQSQQSKLGTKIEKNSKVL